jgi:hypothetical protein
MSFLLGLGPFWRQILPKKALILGYFKALFKVKRGVIGVKL